MGFLDQMVNLADSFMDDCVVCGKSTGDTDEDSGLNVHKKCKPDLDGILTRANSINVTTLSPTGNYTEISPIMVVGTSKAYNLAFDSATFKLKKTALDLDANAVVGIQYQFRSSINEAKNRVCEIMGFGTAIKK